MRKIRKARKKLFKAEKGQRSCFLTGIPHPKEELIRFVVGSDGLVYPDSFGKMDGRGVWLLSSKNIVEQMVNQKIFSKAFGVKVAPVPHLVELVEKMLHDQCLNLLGLANKAGVVLCGFEKIKNKSHMLSFDVLLEASDGTSDGRKKMQKLCQKSYFCSLFNQQELGEALGRELCVHIAVQSGAMALRLVSEIKRYESFIKKEGGCK